MTIKLSSAQEKVLREQAINENEPDSILRDFETFLSFIKEQKVETKGQNGLLPLAVLGELNSLLSKQVKLNLKRPVQKSYPNINGLFLLARTTGLVALRKINGKTFLTIDDEAMTSWQSLNLTEKYFTLLETFLLRANEETIGERYGGSMTCFYKNKYFFEKLSKRDETFEDGKSDESLKYGVGFYNLALFQMFGWVSVTEWKSIGKSWNVKRISITPFGLL